MEKNLNSVDQFFNSLVSFDTETTGVNPKEARIWQLGFTGGGKDIEEVLNPLLDSDNKPLVLSNEDFIAKLRGINGTFSENAYKEGHFNTLISRHNTTRNLSFNLDEKVAATLGQLSANNTLVLQNHRFESELLQQGYLNNSITKTTYDRIKEKMQYTSTNEVTGDVQSLMARPPKVEQYLRQASYIQAAELTDPRISHQQSLNRYTSAMNRVVDSYKKAINNPLRKGAIMIEQQDITKALYANAVSIGIMEPSHLNIGTNMNFLTNTLFDRKELHTALSDSKDTIDVFKKTWGMIEEIRSGNVSNDTREMLHKINTAQYSEVDRLFISSVNSVLSDFSIKGSTSYSPKGNISIKSTTIRSASEQNPIKVDGLSVGVGRKNTRSVKEALDNVLNNYEQHAGSERRTMYVKEIVNKYYDSSIEATMQYAEEKSKTFLRDSPKVAPPNPTLPISHTGMYWNEKTSLLGKEMTRKTKASVVGAGLAGLAYMWLKPAPKQEEGQGYVAEQFYDEQYLGTEFVNFNNRNKHYMY